MRKQTKNSLRYWLRELAWVWYRQKRDVTGYGNLVIKERGLSERQEWEEALFCGSSADEKYVRSPLLKLGACARVYTPTPKRLTLGGGGVGVVWGLSSPEREHGEQERRDNDKPSWRQLLLSSSSSSSSSSTLSLSYPAPKREAPVRERGRKY